MKLLIDKTKARTKLPSVMKAAVRLFVQKGIDGTTIKDIAHKAGVAEGTLYRHFKSKDELAWHLFSIHLDLFTQSLRKGVFEEVKSQARIERFIHICFDLFESERDLFHFLIIHEHEEFRKYPSSKLHPGTLAVQIIKEGQKKGEIRQMEPFLLAGLFVGALIRACVVRIYGRIPKDLRTYQVEVAQSLWAMLRKEESHGQ